MKRREIFATRLKEVRLQTEKSQKEFADMVQSTAATISAYENATKNPSLEIVMNIAEKCNISIDWLSGLSDQKELKPEIKNYKDIALRILELINLDMTPPKFLLTSYKVEVVMDESDFPPQIEYLHEDALQLPYKKELINFFQTYRELYNLLNDSKIKQDVIDTWLNGALEELAIIPIKSNKPSKGNPLIPILKPDTPQEDPPTK